MASASQRVLTADRDRCEGPITNLASVPFSPLIPAYHVKAETCNDAKSVEKSLGLKVPFFQRICFQNSVINFDLPLRKRLLGNNSDASNKSEAMVTDKEF